MADIAIQVENLSKEYRIGDIQASYRTFRDTLTDAFIKPVRRARSILQGEASGASELHRTFWALNDVSFKVEPGESVGIIGRNGAGKSTLLKILSRITAPTLGRVRIVGRVGALLEVGTGFHPELTGRENTFLNGAILGMHRYEIARKFDEIVAFAEVEKFIDTPVKHYSSGMYLRLAFAVAAHLEPEILIVDEVLAVGDANFQKKCLAKMSDVATQGRTVLFVSHNMSAIESMCERVIWLQGGQLFEEGKPQEIIPRYLQTDISANREQTWDDINTAPGAQGTFIHRLAVHPVDGTSFDPITMVTPVVMEFDYWNLLPNAHLNLSLHVYNEMGAIAFSTISSTDPNWGNLTFQPSLYRSVCVIPGHLLNSGLYSVELLIVKDSSYVLYRQTGALTFEVEDSAEVRGQSSWYGKFPGVVHPRLDWTTVQMDNILQSSNERDVR